MFFSLDKFFWKYLYKYNTNYTSVEFEPEAPQATVCC
jgi:hypothetical protein